jgi:hypothetical protein
MEPTSDSIDKALNEYYERESRTTLTEDNIYDMVKATLLERLELQNGRSRNSSERTRADLQEH